MINVLQYNVLAEFLLRNCDTHYARTTSNKAHIANTVALLRDVCKANTVHVLSLQEITPVMFYKLSKALRRDEYKGFYAPEANNNVGCAIFYCTITFSVTAYMCRPLLGNSAKTHKSMCLLQLYHKKGKRRLVVASSHFCWYPDADNVRVQQAKHVLQEMMMLTHDATHVVCVDANTQPNSMPYKVFRENDFETLVAANNTVHSKLRKQKVAYAGIIDYVFVKRGIVHDVATLQSAERLRPFDNANCSDHVPVLAKIELV